MHTHISANIYTHTYTLVLIYKQTIGPTQVQQSSCTTVKFPPRKEDCIAGIVVYIPESLLYIGKYLYIQYATAELLFVGDERWCNIFYDTKKLYEPTLSSSFCNLMSFDRCNIGPKERIIHGCDWLVQKLF